MHIHRTFTTAQRLALAELQDVLAQRTQLARQLVYLRRRRRTIAGNVAAPRDHWTQKTRDSHVRLLADLALAISAMDSERRHLRRWRVLAADAFALTMLSPKGR